MAAVRFDLSIEQGAVYTASWEWREDDGSSPPAGPLIDLTNYDPRLQIRSGDLPMAMLTVDSGLSVVDDVIWLRIGADVTATFTRNGHYDLELHHLTDLTDVERLSQGSVFVDRQVT